MADPVSSVCDPFEAVSAKLPKEVFWESLDIYQWKGFWFRPLCLRLAMAFQSEFESRDNDVILASSMKVGTTWLKALCLCIMNSPSSNLHADEDEDVLTKASPHERVPTIEAMFSAEDPFSIISGLPYPRLLHTHLAYSLLPDSVKSSSCKIVYIARNPKDTLVSLWHFFNEMVGIHGKQALSLEKAFESFCNGTYPQGPFFEHVLEYYLESSKQPEKILFLRYEYLKTDPKGQVRKLASFLGKPFSAEEEVEKVLWRCNIERLKNLEVNKTGRNPWHGVPNSWFFRLGVTGDSENYLTPEMKEHLDEITRVKLEGSGLLL